MSHSTSPPAMKPVDWSPNGRNEVETYVELVKQTLRQVFKRTADEAVTKSRDLRGVLDQGLDHDFARVRMIFQTEPLNTAADIVGQQMIAPEQIQAYVKLKHKVLGSTGDVPAFELLNADAVLRQAR